MVKLHTNFGVIGLELDEERAPETVRNFLDYVESGFYSNTVFHRVIDGFMIQAAGSSRECARNQPAQRSRTRQTTV